MRTYVYKIDRKIYNTSKIKTELVEVTARSKSESERRLRKALSSITTFTIIFEETRQLGISKLKL